MSSAVSRRQPQMIMPASPQTCVSSAVKSPTQPSSVRPPLSTTRTSPGCPLSSASKKYRHFHNVGPASLDRRDDSLLSPVEFLAEQCEEGSLTAHRHRPVAELKFCESAAQLLICRWMGRRFQTLVIDADVDRLPERYQRCCGKHAPYAPGRQSRIG